MSARWTNSMLMSQQDLDFQLFDWLRVDEMTSRPRFADHSRDTFESLLDVSRQIATEHFAPHNKLNDSREPQFVDGRVEMNPEVKSALKVAADTGLVGVGLDHDLGGLQLPHVVHMACASWFQAANISSWGYAFLTTANANLLAAHGSKDQVNTFVRPMIEGRFHGTMCLSEPQAGSSLADITTRAEPQDDGTYRLTGNKMWISGGDHELGENIVHLVLARVVGAPAGVKGISLFIVPKFLVEDSGELGERNDVTLAGLNHKMGFRGTTNAMLNFGEGAHSPGGRSGAVGYIVGGPNKGLSYMFHMMNEARVGVGAGAMALGYTGYLKSKEYAAIRTQGRQRGSDPTTPQIPLHDHSDVRRMLLAQKSYVEGALGLILYCSKLLDDKETSEDVDQRQDAGLLLEVLTPIAKSWPSQWCLQANDLAIQVHGGYGYTREYDVEQHYRDNRLNPIHEGTFGIQAIDLLGRKVVMNDGAGLTALIRTMRATTARAESGAAASLGRRVDAAIDRLESVTRVVHAEGVPSDHRLANASTYLEAAGHVVLAWIWLEQLLASAERAEPFYAGKRHAAEYFIRHELPRTRHQFDLVQSLDTTVLDADPSTL